MLNYKWRVAGAVPKGNIAAITTATLNAAVRRVTRLKNYPEALATELNVDYRCSPSVCALGSVWIECGLVFLRPPHLVWVLGSSWWPVFVFTLNFGFALSFYLLLPRRLLLCKMIFRLIIIYNHAAARSGSP